MTRALVTGGAGFIGSHVVDVLADQGLEVHVVDNFLNGRREHLAGLPAERIHEVDIRDAAGLRQALDAIAPAWVFHLAAIHFIPYCNEHPTESVLINIQGTQNVLDAVRAQGGAERLFFASTAAVYPIKDGAYVETDPVEPLDVYGATKAAGEALVKAFSESTGVPTVIGRLFNAVGHRETNPHLLPEIVQQLKTGSRRLELGNLEPQRDFIDARDMARAIHAATARQGQGWDVFNIGANVQYSVIEVVRMCEAILGESIEVVQDPARVRKVERQTLLAGIDKLKSATGWAPEVDLNRTLREILAA
ncbi:MAG TPA: GDP-mannose 4,6-dehydratase [Caulobacteraceae bacterium]